MPQAGHFAHENIEGWLIELDNIDPIFFEGACFLIEQIGEGHRHLDLVAVMRIGDRIGNCHRPRHRDLEFVPGVRAGKARLRLVHAAFEFQLATHDGHHRLVAVGADSHLDLVREVDAVHEFKKTMHEVLTRHFSIADDVDAGVFLPLDREQCCVELGSGEFIALQSPLRPQLVRLGEPGWLGQAAGDGRREDHAGTVS